MEIYDIDIVRAIWKSIFDDEDIFIASFYENLESNEVLDRYEKKIYDLVYDQNKAQYKARGVVYQIGEADIVNIKSRYMCPFTYGLRLDVSMEDRDYVNAKVINAIENIKGRKFDVVIGEHGDYYITKTPVLTTAGHHNMHLDDNIYMLQEDSNGTIASNNTWAWMITNWFGEEGFYTAPFGLPDSRDYDVYVEEDGSLYRVKIGYTKASPNPTYIIKSAVLIESTFTKRKATLSVNGSQKTEPFINDGVKRITILINGQATITDEYVMLGNDIVLTTIKSSAVASNQELEIEPIELPSALAVDDDTYQTWNSAYLTKDRNMGIKPVVSYLFVVDYSSPFLVALYDFGRYGYTITNPDATFYIKELFYNFGVANVKFIDCKLGNVSINNSNGDMVYVRVDFKIGAY